MADMMTMDEYCGKHSLFTAMELEKFMAVEKKYIRNREYHGMLFQFWQEKRELFLRRINRA